MPRRSTGLRPVLRLWAGFAFCTYFMRPSLLLTTASLCAYYDEEADILLLDLYGELTLAQAQATGVQVGQLALARHYAQVIISTHQLSGITPAAAHWLRQVLAPGLRLLGVCKLAWVCQALPASLALLQPLPAGLPVVPSLFSDLEHAVSWLPGSAGEAAGQAALPHDTHRAQRVVGAFHRHVLKPGRQPVCGLLVSLLHKQRLAAGALA